MFRGTTSRLRSLGERSPTLFLAAGTLLVGYAALHGAEVVTERIFEQKVLHVGYVFGFLGLLGLYPQLSESSPRLTRVGVVTVVLGAVAFVLVTLTDLTVLAGMGSAEPPGWGAIVVAGVAGFVVGYTSFGVAALRSDDFSRASGVLLLTPGVIIVLMLLHMAAGYESQETAFVISSGQALAHLGIGATLRTEDAGSDREETSDESTGDSRAGAKARGEG